jgi:ribonuclease P protein component
VRTSHIEVRLLASPDSFVGRVGILVPKHGHSVVERNRLKRCLRELARLYLLPDLKDRDLLLRAIPETYDASFNVLRDEIESIIVQMKSLKS